MPAITVAKINKALAAEGLPVSISRGDGYQYFTTNEPHPYATHSVMVYRLSDMTLADWVIEGRDFAIKQGLI